jgi:uncharacterized membrane protein YdjX (TVP38/TMEM64 family)
LDPFGPGCHFRALSILDLLGGDAKHDVRESLMRPARGGLPVFAECPAISNMTNTVPPDYQPVPPRQSMMVRLGLLLIIIVVAAVAAYVIFKTALGEKLRDKELVREWVARHRAITPLVIVTVYVIFAVLLLPVWEIQYVGIFWCEVGAVIGAAVSLLLSRWLVGEWFRTRYEARMAKLHAINEKLGHNGLLVVMGVRLCHVLPFGVSNYLFGLTRITVMDVVIGTLGGGLPAISIYVALGADPVLLKTFLFWGVFSLIHILLLIPLILRYLKPEWFKRIGVE